MLIIYNKNPSMYTVLD